MSQFISRQARIACNLLGTRLSETKVTDTKTIQSKAHSFASQTNKVVPVVPEPVKSCDTKKNLDDSAKCSLCEGKHKLEACDAFKTMTLPDRKEFVKKSG